MKRFTCVPIYVLKTFRTVITDAITQIARAINCDEHTLTYNGPEGKCKI